MNPRKVLEEGGRHIGCIGVSACRAADRRDFALKIKGWNIACWRLELHGSHRESLQLSGHFSGVKKKSGGKSPRGIGGYLGVQLESHPRIGMGCVSQVKR